MPLVQDGEKAYRFTITWGVETNSDDADGQITARSEARPETAVILAALPRVTGRSAMPPDYSAIKIAGERAYDIARDGEMPQLTPRPVTIHELVLVSAGRDEATFEARCGKGASVRAIARDLGRTLGCYGHVSALRRAHRPFAETDAMPLALIEEAAAPDALRRVEAGSKNCRKWSSISNSAARLRRGQSVLLRGRDAPGDGAAYASCGGVVVAIGAIERGELVPGRVFNLPF